MGLARGMFAFHPAEPRFAYVRGGSSTRRLPAHHFDSTTGGPYSFSGGFNSPRTRFVGNRPALPRLPFRVMAGFLYRLPTGGPRQYRGLCDQPGRRTPDTGGLDRFAGARRHDFSLWIRPHGVCSLPTRDSDSIGPVSRLMFRNGRLSPTGAGVRNGSPVCIVFASTGMAAGPLVRTGLHRASQLTPWPIA